MMVICSRIDGLFTVEEEALVHLFVAVRLLQSSSFSAQLTDGAFGVDDGIVD